MAPGDHIGCVFIAKGKRAFKLSLNARGRNVYLSYGHLNCMMTCVDAYVYLTQTVMYVMLLENNEIVHVEKDLHQENAVLFGCITHDNLFMK